MRELRVDYGQASIVKSNMSMSLSYLEDEISKINSAINDIESLNRSYGKTSTILNELYDQKKKAQQSYDEMQEFNEKFSKFISNVKTTDTELAKKFTSDVKTYCKKNNIEITSELDAFLDKVQVALDLAGWLPIVGDVADGINAEISLCRGNYLEALICVVAMLPFGDMLKSLKYADEAKGILKYGDEFLKGVKTVAKEGSEKLSKQMSKVIKSGKLDNVIASMDAGKHYIVKMRDGTVTAIEKTGLPEKIRVCLGNGCFIAGTLVTTRLGLKPIEKIVIGDYVLSRFEGLQVKPYWEDGMNFAEYRSKMMAYEIIEPIDAAFGITKANHQFGSGGLPQMFIPNFKELLSNGKIKKVELKAVKLSNYKMELKVMMNG